MGQEKTKGAELRVTKKPCVAPGPPTPRSFVSTGSGVSRMHDVVEV